MERTYWSIVVKLPAGPKGIVETKIARHPKDRKRMAPMPVHFTKSVPDSSSSAILPALIACSLSSCLVTQLSYWLW